VVGAINLGGVILNTNPPAGGQIRDTTRAFTLIEIVIDFGIFAAISLAIVTGYYASYKSIDLARSKMVAVALANEKIEKLRNMPYDDLATAHGSIYPVGQILDSENVESSGIKLTVTTKIEYHDDPYDGNAEGTIAGKPRDVYPYDYKRVQVTVSHTGRNGRLAEMTTDVAARAAETPSDTGILYICVKDKASQPVPDATITIENSTLTPALSLVVQSGDDGCVMIPKLPPDEHNNYRLVITKDGYSTFQTYPRTAQNPNAYSPDVNVILQQVESHTYIIDRVSTLKLAFVDQNNNPVSNLSFTLEGSEKKYFNPDTFEYSTTFTTDSEGKVTVENLRFDQYKIVNIPSPYYLVTATPMQPIDLLPDSVLEAKIVLGTDSAQPTIYSITPQSGIQNMSVSITVEGTNFNNGATIKLINPTTGAEIVGTNVEIHSHSTIITDLSLAGADPGSWNVVVTNPDGKSVTQINGFAVSQ